MFLIGLCPLLPWRGRDRSRLVKDAAWTAAPAVVALVVLLALGLRKPYTLLSFTLATFAAASIALQYGRGWRNRHKAAGKGWLRAFGGMVWGNRSRYGGFLVHLGVIVVLVGITGSYAFKQVVDGDLSKGGSLDVGRFELTYDGLALEQAADKQMARATFTVSHDGQVVGHVDPVKEYYPASDQIWTRVDLYSTLAGDVYVSLLGYADDGSQRHHSGPDQPVGRLAMDRRGSPGRGWADRPVAGEAVAGQTARGRAGGRLDAGVDRCLSRGRSRRVTAPGIESPPGIDSPPEPAVLVRDLRKSYGPVEALRGLDLRVEPGVFLTIFGPNGAGKTTLMKVLSTLTRPTEGSALVGGKDVVREAGGGSQTSGRHLAQHLSLRAAHRPSRTWSSTPACTGCGPVASGLSRCWPRWISPSACTTGWPPTHGACSSVSRWRGLCCTILNCCCSTSPTPDSTSMPPGCSPKCWKG